MAKEARSYSYRPKQLSEAFSLTKAIIPFLYPQIFSHIISCIRIFFNFDTCFLSIDKRQATSDKRNRPIGRSVEHNHPNFKYSCRNSQTISRYSANSDRDSQHFICNSTNSDRNSSYFYRNFTFYDGNSTNSDRNIPFSKRSFAFSERNSSNSYGNIPFFIPNFSPNSQYLTSKS